MDPERARFKGEVGQLGALVPGGYLDDTQERLGSRLKLMCRVDCLPTMQKVAQERRLGPGWATCLMCPSGEAEEVKHVLLDCEAYRIDRERLFRRIERIYPLKRMDAEEQVVVLLGNKREYGQKVNDVDDGDFTSMVMSSAGGMGKETVHGHQACGGFDRAKAQRNLFGSRCCAACEVFLCYC
jgi:hypothetical protein